MPSSPKRKTRTTKVTAKSLVPQVTGGMLDVSCEEETEIWERAVASFRKTKTRMDSADNRRITFERGPVALAFGADFHLGGAGVDYERLERELRIVADTPNMYMVVLGDTVDNFILPKLMHARFNSKVAPTEEWILLRRCLRIIADKLLVVVSGNHEGWLSTLAGIDYFRDQVERIKGNNAVIYDFADVVLKLRVGKADFPIRLRHKWRGSSIYNLTHGIERAQKWDQNFRVGVGGHTHSSGLVRTFNAGTQTALAVLCGTFKVFDEYAVSSGFSLPNHSTIQTVLFFEDGNLQGVENVELASKLMCLIHDRPEFVEPLNLIFDAHQRQWTTPLRAIGQDITERKRRRRV